MAVSTSADAAKPAKWWQPLVAPVASAMLTGAITGSGVLYAMGGKEERTRSQIEAIGESIKAQAAKLRELDESDRATATLPLQVQQAVERIAKLEAIAEEARRTDGQTTERLSRLETTATGIADQLRTLSQDVRTLIVGSRFGGAAPYRAGDPATPAFRPN